MISPSSSPTAIAPIVEQSSGDLLMNRSPKLILACIETGALCNRRENTITAARGLLS
jgi:hypothetical protein